LAESVAYAQANDDAALHALRDLIQNSLNTDKAEEAHSADILNRAKAAYSEAASQLDEDDMKLSEKAIGIAQQDVASASSNEANDQAQLKAIEGILALPPQSRPESVTLEMRGLHDVTTSSSRARLT